MALEGRPEKIELELTRGPRLTDEALAGRSGRWFLKLGRLNRFGRWADRSMQAGRISWLIAGIILLFGSLVAFSRAATAHSTAQGGTTSGRSGAPSLGGSRGPSPLCCCSLPLFG